MKKQSFDLLVAILLLGVAATASASDHGCQCLLCLANPNGPKAAAECRPPIDKLFHDLSRGKRFPTCDMAQGSNGRSYAEQGQSYFDMCPSGTAALAAGSIAIQGSGNIAPLTYTGPVYVGIGSGDDWYPPEEWAPATKVCVGNAVGKTTVMQENGEYSVPIDVTVYDRVALLDAQGSPRVIDVYIDDVLYRRVRW